MAEKLLPLGSVVKVREKGVVMIGGYLHTGPARPGYVYDYAGFPYPLGYEDMTSLVQFDTAEIEEIFAMGYQDHVGHDFILSVEAGMDEAKAGIAKIFEDHKEE